MNDIYTKAVTAYCERTSRDGTSEPWNAVSNFAFFIVAFFIYRLFKKQSALRRNFWILLFLAVFIGFGSLLWHTIPNPLTHFLDAGPIWLFIAIFVYEIFRFISKSKKLALLSILFIAIVQISVTIWFPQFLNGSLRHAINGVIFAVISFLFIKKYRFVSLNLVSALTSYIVAIYFRTIDNEICSIIPTGSHFLWHIFNSLAIYFSLKILLELDKLEKDRSEASLDAQTS